MRTSRASLYSLLVIIALMLAVLGMSLKLEYFASRLLPMVIGSMVLVLACIELVREIKAEYRLKSAVDADKGRIEEQDGIKTSKYARYVTWLVGFSLAIYLVGFIISIALFVGAYMKRHGATWFSTITTAVIYTIIIYAVFNLALQVDLYKGKILIGLGL